MAGKEHFHFAFLLHYIIEHIFVNNSCVLAVGTFNEGMQLITLQVIILIKSQEALVNMQCYITFIVS